MPDPATFGLKARYVFPVAAEPLGDATVTIQGQRITSVGRQPSGREPHDLGNVAILPGLVNSHCHLEFSDLSQPLGQPGVDFVHWVRALIARRGQTSLEPFDSIQRGIQESRRVGTTAIADIAQPGRPSPLYEAAGLDCTVLLELITPKMDRISAAMDLAELHLDRRRSPSVCWGLSPHAPYSVHPELLERVVHLSRVRQVPVAMHLAETRQELELLRSAAGPFRHFLDDLGAWDPTALPGGKRPLDYLKKLAEAHRALVIHGNYLDDEEIGLVAELAGQMAVVYCPRSHAHFAHEPYPLAAMLAAGVTVALGTDSRASAPDLSVLAEMRMAAARHPDVAPEVILRLGTLQAARALGRDHQIGSLEPGKLADLTIVALPETEAADPFEMLLGTDLPVVGRYYRGTMDGLML